MTLAAVLMAVRLSLSTAQDYRMTTILRPDLLTGTGMVESVVAPGSVTVGYSDAAFLREAFAERGFARTRSGTTNGGDASELIVGEQRESRPWSDAMTVLYQSVFDGEALYGARYVDGATRPISSGTPYELDPAQTYTTNLACAVFMDGSAAFARTSLPGGIMGAIGRGRPLEERAVRGMYADAEALTNMLVRGEFVSSRTPWSMRTADYWEDFRPTRYEPGVDGEDGSFVYPVPQGSSSRSFAVSNEYRRAERGFMAYEYHEVARAESVVGWKFDWTVGSRVQETYDTSRVERDGDGASLMVCVPTNMTAMGSEITGVVAAFVFGRYWHTLETDEELADGTRMRETVFDVETGFVYPVSCSFAGLVEIFGSPEGEPVVVGSGTMYYAADVQTSINDAIRESLRAAGDVQCVPGTALGRLAFPEYPSRRRVLSPYTPDAAYNEARESQGFEIEGALVVFGMRFRARFE